MTAHSCRDEFTLALAEKKAHYPFSVCLCKGILANWLVNLAVWIANSAQDITGERMLIMDVLRIACFEMFAYPRQPHTDACTTF